MTRINVSRTLTIEFRFLLAFSTGSTSNNQMLQTFVNHHISAVVLFISLFLKHTHTHATTPFNFVIGINFEAKLSVDLNFI